MSPETDVSPDDQRDSRAQRASLRRAYKDRTRQAGVFRVVNTATGRVFLGSGLDLHAPLNRVAFELDMRVSRIRELNDDVALYGRDSFAIEVLETIEPRDDPDFDPRRELEALEERYLNALDWSTAYNRDRRIRYP